MSQVNERWLQFGYVNAKGTVVKTALKMPFHADLTVDEEIQVTIKDTFTSSPVSVKRQYQTTVTP